MLAFAPREAPISILHPIICGIDWAHDDPMIAATLTAAEVAMAPRRPSQ